MVESPTLELSPEGLTSNQERLCEMFFDPEHQVEVDVKVRKKDGSEVIERRKTGIFDFRREDEEGFLFKLHEASPNAPASPFKLEIRGDLSQAVLSQIGIVLKESEQGRRPDFCTGIPKAGVALAKAYSEASGVELVDIFEKEEVEGKRKIKPKKHIQGKSFQTIRIVDDLITGGETKLEAIRAAREMGFFVLDVMVIVDRQQGGRDQIEAERYKLISAFTIRQLLSFGLRRGLLGEDRFDEASSYLKSSKKNS